MYTYASPPRSKRGPTVASNLGRKAAALSAQAQASLHRRAGSPRPAAAASFDVSGGTAQQAAAPSSSGTAGGRGQQGRSAREAFVVSGDAQFKVPAQKGSGAGQGASTGANEDGGRAWSSLLKTRTGARFDGRAPGTEAPRVQQRSMPYSRPLQSPPAHSRGSSRVSSSASTRVQVAIVESLALVPHTSQTDQQHETAPVDIDAVYYQYGAMRQSQEAKRTPAGRGAPALDDGYSSSPTPQSEGARQPRDRSEGASHRGQTRSNGSERAALSSDEPSQAGQVREATAYQRRPQPPVQDDAYSPYFQQPGAVGQVEETDDVGTDVSGDEEDDEGRFQEIANGESDQFDYDPAQTQFGAGPALANSSGEWTSNGDEPRAGTSGGHDDAAEQWGAMDAGPLINEILGDRQQEIVANARARWSAVDINDTQAWLDGGRELAQRFADLNKVITNYAAGSTANFAAIMEDVAAYERDQQRTARKLEGYAQDLEKWGADITSTSRQ